MSETAWKGLKVLENVGVKYKTFFLLSLSYYHQIFTIMSGGHWATEKWGRIPKNKQQQKNWRERLAMRTEETPFFFYSPPPSVQYRAECRSVFAYSRQQQSVLPQLLLHVPDQKHTNTHKVSHNTHTLKPTNPCPQTVSHDLVPQEDISHITGKNIWLLLYYSHWKKKHGCQTDISTIANLAASCWGDSSWYYRYYKQG